MRREGGKAGHRGSSIHERQPFLALEHGRSKPGAAQCVSRGKTLAFDTRMADPNQEICQMGQRDKVAAGAERTFAGNFGQYAAVQRRQQHFNQLFANTREASSQRVGASQHDGARLDRRKEWSLADGEMMEQIKLMLSEFLVANTKTAEGAETGV